MVRLALSVVLLSLGTVAFAGPIEDEIAARISKVGSVCVAGEPCASGSASAPTVVAAADGGGAEANYNKTCATCHNAGVAGAPKLGDASQWATRVAKGKDALYQSAINGLPPAMPAKGMCFQCSDDDLKSIVDYMINAAQ